MGTLSEEVQRLVRHQRLGYVATVSADGSPTVSPKGSLTVLDDSHLVFADIESPHTVRNLESNPKVEVNVVDPLSRRGARFRGRARVLRSGGEYWKALEAYKAEGSDIRRVQSVVIVEVDHVAPLVSPIYASGISEREVEALWQEYYSKNRAKTVVDLVPPRDF